MECDVTTTTKKKFPLFWVTGTFKKDNKILPIREFTKVNNQAWECPICGHYNVTGRWLVDGGAGETIDEVYPNVKDTRKQRGD